MRPRVNGVAEATEREATPGFLRDKGVLVEEGAGRREWHQDTWHPESTGVNRSSITAMLGVKGASWKSH